MSSYNPIIQLESIKINHFNFLDAIYIITLVGFITCR